MWKNLSLTAVAINMNDLKTEQIQTYHNMQLCVHMAEILR